METFKYKTLFSNNNMFRGGLNEKVIMFSDIDFSTDSFKWL